jgi:exopolysaccharide biosynthesis predicted pyruvyltransferase EpsI
VLVEDHQQPLRTVFSCHSQRPFLFVRPGGNWGDHLIYLGAEQLAGELGLKWRTLTYEQFLAEPFGSGHVIYLHGGGGFTTLASGKAPRCLKKALKVSGAVVIQGPCTLANADALVELREDIRSSRVDRLVFFTREQRSADIAAAELPSSVERLVNEDTALYLTRDILLKRAGMIRPRMHLLAIREDSEAVTQTCVATRNAVFDPARFARSFDHWIRIHLASKSILTNRTHSAVCGAILDIPTTMFAGAYHKNRSFWEFSLDKRGVMWLDDSEAIPQRQSVDPLLAWIPARRIRESWKLDRMAKALRGIPLS